LNTQVCAPNDMKIRFPSKFKFDWHKLENHVKKLQARIVKAYQSKKYNKVKVLQWILKQSFSSKILAIKRVTQNKGKKTPGVDGVTWITDTDKLNAIHTLTKVGYKAKPLRRTFINKKNGKKRPLGIPTMKDRTMQALYLMGLDPIAETVLDGDTYGFRKKRSTADAVSAIFKSVRGNKNCAEWILEGDIKGCFDNISHDWLMSNIPMDKKILKEWLNSGIVFNKEYFDTIAGVPQGSIISPCLANLALNGLGSMLQDKFMKHKKVNGKEVNNKVHTIVYADDFIITGGSKELLENEVLPEVKRFMIVRGLELSEEKTLITNIKDGFNFLGQNIRKYNDGKVIIKPTNDNVKRFLDGVRETIKSNPTVKQEKLIKWLNPKIRGWSNYHRYSNAKHTFSYVDRQIYYAITSWCRRRHPKKGKWWVNNKYYHSIGTRNWVFGAKVKNKEMEILLLSADTKIIKYTKIQREANPYDPDWYDYFAELEGIRMFGSTKGRKELRKLWEQQNGKCPCCMEDINKESGWRFYKDNEGRKKILHPRCFEKVNNKKDMAVNGDSHELRTA